MDAGAIAVEARWDIAAESNILPLLNLYKVLQVLADHRLDENQAFSSQR